MSWLCWNVRGLGNRRTVRKLGSLVRAQDPNALFLAETWSGEDFLKRLCRELLFDHFWIVPQVNRTGCLALFWKNSVHIEVISSSPNHIDTIVGSKPETKWRFTSIYGFAEAARKHETWSMIRSLHHSISLPWLCTGDFNEILWSHEKLGLASRPEGGMKLFRDVLDECGLKDFGYAGEKFTWKGKRQGVWFLRGSTGQLQTISGPSLTRAPRYSISIPSLRTTNQLSSIRKASFQG
ncbi:uncharacterized protein LOC142632512 [Castanea sativa]|uniref:uncharacterized protein LOC142632512 n=1 Tax=Castanea sativa TaxID=21020 RepID=UPI003F64ADDA